MKLISFIAISFLAITVSAKPPPRYSYKSIRSSQSSRQFSQAEVEDEIERLTVEYEKEEDIFAPIENDAKIKRQNVWTLKKQAALIMVELRETAAGSDARSKLDQKYYDAKTQFDVLNSEYHRQYPDYAKLRRVRDDAKAVLGLLRGNQDLVKKHNDKYGVKMGPSLGSFYSIGFLEHQKDSIPKEIDPLVDELERIKGFLEGLEELEGIEVDKNELEDNLVARSDKLEDKIRLLRSQCRIAKKILREHKQRQSMGAHV
ncbi:hypothetical protein BASA62_005922 [Batrachochytrium salamandrivorans]|nr:hypothetical protein BASA62_005922 [Batrachochytrium salamandrivorans]